jgi:hypothetical protein
MRPMSGSPLLRNVWGIRSDSAARETEGNGPQEASPAFVIPLLKRCHGDSGAAQSRAGAGATVATLPRWLEH